MECHVCGGKEFNINVGKQMCAECGTENEKYVEVAAAEETIGCNANRHRIVHVSEQVIDAASASKLATGTSAYSKWTTYEAYTFVLQDWSLALVKLGASASLPELVLRMWAGYLNKIEVAFLETKIRNNQSVPKTPKVGLLRNKRRDMHEYKYFEPYTPTFAKLVALLYIACRVNGEEMLLLDLLNWCNSNHLPYQAAPYLLEDSMIDLTRLDLYQLRQCKSVPWHGHVYRLVIKLSVLLDAQLLPLPRSDVVTKSLAPSVSALVQRWPIDQLESPYKFEVHSPETFVAAIIVLLLKMSWGLDGVQEDKLSCQVLRINAELRRHGSKHRLFCWRTWHRHINRLLWFNETVDLSGPRHPFRRPPLNHSMDLSSLVHSFWSEGLWRRSRSTAKREDSLAPLFHQLLRTNDQSITKLLNEERLFNVTYHHLTGVAQQYKHCWLNDVRADKDDMKQVADEICRTSFECHQFDFLSNVKPVQAALASSGSELRVQVKSMNNGVEDLDPSDDEEDLELRSNEIHLVNPLEHFWHAPSAIMGSAPDGIRHARSAIRSSAPQSFWWLLEVVAFVCREKPENLLSKFKLTGGEVEWFIQFELDKSRPNMPCA
ncbi:hypothetical protein HAZT_HAZT008810 [Hyalella azteca]|uniref:Rrn7/TAF1B N-terminal cyclin domain-containing protein n=1 Tax=Hyalella azteca TaxID=294128 RepID=A0A6A0GPG5_HYAAZ|nr:hypothetical protein HAZT_HAZT008810 [Hyalella azteca]